MHQLWIDHLRRFHLEPEAVRASRSQSHPVGQIQLTRIKILSKLRLILNGPRTLRFNSSSVPFNKILPR